MRQQTTWRMDIVSQGLRLRSLGLCYSAIAVVLAEYHDFPVSEGAVRCQLRRFGAPACPRGEGLGSLRRAESLSGAAR